MAHQEGNKPKHNLKIGNMNLALFINQNKNTGIKYAIYRIQRFRFPFKFNGQLDLTAPEFEKLKEIFEKFPEIEIKQKTKKVKK